MSGKILIIFLLLPGILFCQESLLSKKLSLQSKNQTLGSVLDEITNQCRVHFSYNSEAIDANLNISLDVTDKTLKYALDQLKKNYQLEYELIGNQIVLKKAMEKEKPLPRYTLSGYFRDAGTSESLPGATLVIGNTATGTITNAYGFFSITLPEGDYLIRGSFMGYKNYNLDLSLRSDQEIVIPLEFNTKTLQEVVIQSNELTDFVEHSQMSKITVNPMSLASLPEFAGEVGLIRSLQSFPGFKTHSDGSAFFFVRGGNKDQNMILIDDAPVFNPAHLFGYYSVIIPEVAKSINIYKGDLPFEKSERISSLIDVQTKDGNMKHFHVEGVLNPLMNRIAFEGPFKKDKSSFFTSYRRSNFEWLYRRAAPNSDIYLYDFNTKLNFILNPANRIYFSVFRGMDNLTNNNEGIFGGIQWSNTTATLRWNHVFSRDLFANLTLYGSNYNYALLSPNVDWKSELGNLCLKADFSWFRTPEHTIRYGINLGNVESNPGNLEISTENIDYPKIAKTHSRSRSLYLSDEYRLNRHFSIRAGFRLPVWVNRGPTTVYLYDTTNQVADTLKFQEDERVKTYVGFDPGISLKYMPDSTSSFKLSWGQYHQYLNLLSNSISPFSSFETWLPAGSNIKPQKASQVALGFVKLFPKTGLEVSFETYYKSMQNQMDYEPHASLLLNPLIEGELRFGDAYSYGAEFMIRRTQGRLNGWVSYTWSKTRTKIEGVNGNKEFPPFYDRPHDFSIFINYPMSRKISFSFNWIYYSGSAITTPVGFYIYNGYTVPLYEDKNNDRLPDYHRLDVAMTWDINKPSRNYKHSLVFAVYNFYNQLNPVSVNFNKIETRDGKFVVPSNLFGTEEIWITQKYLLGIMPSITYKFSL